MTQNNTIYHDSHLIQEQRSNMLYVVLDGELHQISVENLDLILMEEQEKESKNDNNNS